MLFSPIQHQKMAGLLHKKSVEATDPEARKRLIAFAEVHRKPAQSAAKKAKPAESEPPVADDGPTRKAVRPRGMEYSVPDDLPYIMMDGPNSFGTLESLEQYLAELQAMPDFVLKESMIDQTEWFIARKKKFEAERKTKE
jgi:hypothetical protein